MLRDVLADDCCWIGHIEQQGTDAGQGIPQGRGLTSSSVGFDGGRRCAGTRARAGCCWRRTGSCSGWRCCGCRVWCLSRGRCGSCCRRWSCCCSSGGGCCSCCRGCCGRRRRRFRQLIVRNHDQRLNGVLFVLLGKIRQLRKLVRSANVLTVDEPVRPEVGGLLEHALVTLGQHDRLVQRDRTGHVLAVHRGGVLGEFHLAVQQAGQIERNGFACDLQVRDVVIVPHDDLRGVGSGVDVVAVRYRPVEGWDFTFGLQLVAQVVRPGHLVLVVHRLPVGHYCGKEFHRSSQHHRAGCFQVNGVIGGQNAAGCYHH
uniref:(northern house mosquito) hypothetical protein n=1 Tax=Culex pipiens TaxID=7175 RepID=A0A8D8L828_CULPI